MTENPDVQQIASAAREQLELILRDPGFRSSRRSAQFLKYVVEKTLDGEADQIKERTIGVDVFGRKPSYDTNEDHVVRTAAGGASEASCDLLFGRETSDRTTNESGAGIIHSSVRPSDSQS